ncbi:MAG: hypothetical protein CfClM3_0589 [Methanobrevibacter sp. CfCl-M3]
MTKENAIKFVNNNSSRDYTPLVTYIFRDNFSIDDLEEFIKTMKEEFKSIINHLKRGGDTTLDIYFYTLFFQKIMGVPKEEILSNSIEDTVYRNLVNYIYDNDLDLSEVKKFAEIFEGRNDTTIMYPDNRGEIIDTQNHFTKYAVYELNIGEKVYYGYSLYTDNKQLENRVKMWLNDDKEGHVYNADVLVAFKRYGVFDLDIKYIVDTIDEAQSIKSNFIKYTDKTKLYNKKR